MRTIAGADGFKATQDEFAHILQNLMETPEVFGQRRNRFLNHLLARFGEDAEEYERVSHWLTPYPVNERLIRDKTNILKNGEYFRVSSNRGTGYDYAHPDFWDTRNVSSTERRVSRLLGFADATRRTLAPEAVVSEAVMEIDPEHGRNTQEER